MTPEERFTKIENLLDTLTVRAVHHDTQIEQLNAGIRDLTVVARTIVDSQQQTVAQIQGLTDAQRRTNEKLQELADAQRHTDESLNNLIHIVDQIIRDRKNGHS